MMSTPAVSNPRLEDICCLEAVSINDPLSVNDDDEGLTKVLSMKEEGIK